MNPCNGMVSPPVPATPGNHGRYRHIHLGAYVFHLGAYVLVHHVSSLLRFMRIAHSHDVLDSSLHTPDQAKTILYIQYIRRSPAYYQPFISI